MKRFFALSLFVFVSIQVFSQTDSTNLLYIHKRYEALSTNQKDSTLLMFLDSLIFMDPQNSAYYALKADYFKKTNEYDSVIYYYHEALKIIPDNFLYNYSLGAAYVNLGSKNVSESYLPTNNELKKKFTHDNQKLDSLLFLAKPFLEKALSINPTDSITKSALKNIYVRLGLKSEITELMKNE